MRHPLLPRRLGHTAAIVAVFWHPAAYAEGAAAGSVVLAPGSGQVAVSVRVQGTDLLYKACAGQAPCSASSSDGVLHLPPGTDASSMVMDVLSVGQGRHILWAHGPKFGALLGSIPNGEGVRVLWSGPVGLSRGEPGEQTGELVSVTSPDSEGTVRVLVGDVREDLSICGRPSILSPRVLDARDLVWKGAIVQRLTPEEREHATTIAAAPEPPDRTPPLARLLQAVGGSSAIGSPGALTDGDLETTWAEQRTGDGRGEFVQMNVPEQAEITSVSFVVRPPQGQPAKGVGPKKVWLATPDALYGVVFPDDGWAHPGVAYEARFPSPIRSRCLTLVLDEAYGRGRTDIDVTLAEVTAHTEFDQNPNPAALAGALAGGQARARMAASILTRSGAPGFQAVIEAYPALDDAGRVLALEVIDNAPCETSAPLYVTALTAGRPGEVRHATDRIVRCGRAAAPPLSALLSKGPSEMQVGVAGLLALVAPDLAVDQIADLLPTVNRQIRVGLRAALARATQSEASDEIVRKKLENPKITPLASLDLLRSIHLRPALVQPAADALIRLGSGSSDVRTRYLMQVPAATLARAGEGRAQTMLAQAIASDPDAHVRARAAQAATGLSALAPTLVHAIADGDPRVRDAALSALAQADASTLTPAVPGAMERLHTEPWTFVRQHAVDVLAHVPAATQVDKALADSLGDDTSPLVRARLADALGRRKARDFAPVLQERLDDAHEDVEVRANAARALGRMCDRKYVEVLTTYARNAAMPGPDPRSLTIGLSAVAGLGELFPGDLAARLAPLMGAKAAGPLREAAKNAMVASERCPR